MWAMWLYTVDEESSCMRLSDCRDPHTLVLVPLMCTFTIDFWIPQVYISGQCKYFKKMSRTKSIVPVYPKLLMALHICVLMPVHVAEGHVLMKSELHSESNNFVMQFCRWLMSTMSQMILWTKRFHSNFLHYINFLIRILIGSNVQLSL
jgi:hypothetical protein